jgi:ribonuclease HII
MLISQYSDYFPEAGCDEAGRGCLAGPVFAAAVVFPKGYFNKELNDSKKLSEKKRYYLREIIQKEAISYAVSFIDNDKIDEINILNASIQAMHDSLNQLSIMPKHIIIDGNRFKNYNKIPHLCIIKGDTKYLSIAAASILAKTYRDDYMQKINKDYPIYLWSQNKGYPTKLHREAIKKHGDCQYHRKSFTLLAIN